MNHSAQNSVMGSDSLLIQPELCEVCDGKDDEDLYIVFNALYRVIVGDVFYHGSDPIEKQLGLNSLPISLNQQKQKDFKTSQEKLQTFRKRLSSQALIDLVALPRFDLLLREIFKSKYNRVQDTSCKHQELAMNFIRNFNLKNDEFFGDSDLNKRRLIENTEKLDILYNKIKQLKNEIETYHSEIDGLSERIVKKLLPNNSHFISKKVNVCDDDRDDSDDQASECHETYPEKKTSRNKSESLHGSVSTGLSSESSSNYDKSDEEKLERKHKKSKTATFKSKLPKKATDVLKNWFLNNIQNPYPSHEAKELLSKMTGLTRKQIQNWFTNSRKRFLEPLKKKIEGQKNGKEGSLTLDQAGDIFTSETQSPIDQSDSVCQSITQEPILITQTATQSKSKPTISFPSSNLQALSENITKPVTFPKTSPQISSPAQSMMYPQANNFVVVPWVTLPQPVYPYRPSYPNLLSMSSPQIIPLQQNNYPTNFPLVDTASALPNQFGFTMPTNFMDVGAMMKQQMPATFNAMNANLYNSMSQSVGQLLSANQDRMPFVNNLQRSTSSLYHPRPELSELHRLGPKFLHKDNGHRVNLG